MQEYFSSIRSVPIEEVQIIAEEPQQSTLPAQLSTELDSLDTAQHHQSQSTLRHLPWMLPPHSTNQYPPADKSRSDRPFPHLDEIHKALLVYNSPAVIHPVGPLLDDYFCRKNTRVTDFQSKLFKGTIEHPDTEWPVVEWNEPDLDSEIFSIFKVNIEHWTGQLLDTFGNRWKTNRWATVC